MRLKRASRTRKIKELEPKSLFKTFLFYAFAGTENKKNMKRDGSPVSIYMAFYCLSGVSNDPNMVRFIQFLG